MVQLVRQHEKTLCGQVESGKLLISLDYGPFLIRNDFYYMSI